MTNLSPEFCRRIKQARRSASLSQSDLAREVGCKQSALSMFEQGDGTKLNDEVIGRLSKKFGVEIPKTVGGDAPPSPAGALSPALAPCSGFCPNPSCPSNHAYLVESRRLFRPARDEADPVGGRFCAVCGEVLERLCPACGSPVHAGAVCSFCGSPYVAG